MQPLLMDFIYQNMLILWVKVTALVCYHGVIETSPFSNHSIGIIENFQLYIKLEKHMTEPLRYKKN